MILQPAYSLNPDVPHYYRTETRQASYITKPAGVASRTVERYIDEFQVNLLPAAHYDVRLEIPYQVEDTRALVGIAIVAVNVSRMWVDVLTRRYNASSSDVSQVIRASNVFTQRSSSTSYPSAPDTTFEITGSGTLTTLPGVQPSLRVKATIICEDENVGLELKASIRSSASISLMEFRPR